MAVKIVALLLLAVLILPVLAGIGRLRNLPRRGAEDGPEHDPPDGPKDGPEK